MTCNGFTRPLIWRHLKLHFIWNKIQKHLYTKSMPTETLTDAERTYHQRPVHLHLHHIDCSEKRGVGPSRSTEWIHKNATTKRTRKLKIWFQKEVSINSCHVSLSNLHIKFAKAVDSNEMWTAMRCGQQWDVDSNEMWTVMRCGQ